MKCCRRERQERGEIVCLASKWIKKQNYHWINFIWWVCPLWVEGVSTSLKEKVKRIKKKKSYPKTWCQLEVLFSSQSEPKWIKHFQLLIGAMNSYNIYYGYRQLQDASNMTPLTLCLITLKHNQQCGLISMCRLIHMSIKLRNQATEQRHGKNVYWHPFLTYQTRFILCGL